MTVLKSRRVVLPDGERPAALVIEDGRIAAIASYDTAGEDVTAILPGLVDTHVHVNEPGRTSWEGFATATAAAAAGGVTTIVDMPLNSVPVTTGPEAGVTVTITGFGAGPPRPPRPPRPPCGNRNRCCSVGGSYFFPIPAKSPVGEWHPLHLPSPLKKAAPALASPVSTS